ncbi:MAG TPA: tRNA preQ1(34) S-adenosylmethionine ribosyltransferase-isomerase QueA [Oculatellaceae cyanobacterium]
MSEPIKSVPATEAADLNDYSYDLPVELIADKPLSTREHSRFLVLDRTNETIEHTRFDALPTFLKAGDVLVVNDTKVIPAKIFAQRASGGNVSLLLIKPETSRPGLWQAMVQPIKRIKPGEYLQTSTVSGAVYQIKVVDIITADDGYKRLLLDLGGGSNVFKLLSEIGSAPLPPYIARDKGTDNSANAERSDTRSFDLERYQTVFAKAPGAVAAPTAGLHFSDDLLSKLKQNGVQVNFVTLHVGPGTFKPIEDSIEEHFIEPEIFFVPESTAAAVNQAKLEGRRVIAVGTTSMRALESAASGEGVRIVDGESTNLYVKPGYKFKVVDALITNFHLSRSSLLVLVSTFAGKELIMKAYEEAISQRYRFYSYGDAMFIC